MKRRNTYVGLILLLAVLMLGIGYAAMSNITLNIGGSASAIVEDENFKVKFTGTPEVSSSDVTATITDDHNATLNVTGLSAKGDKVTATYTIENASEDLSASVAVPTITNSNEDYFTVTTDMSTSQTLAAGGNTTVTVTVELVKTPVDADQTADIKVSLVASPVQP